jgi:hypothetical protein
VPLLECPMTDFDRQYWKEQPHQLYRQVRDFEVRTGRTPAEFAAAWREGKIKDTPHNASDAIEALALHEAMQ